MSEKSHRARSSLGPRRRARVTLGLMSLVIAGCLGLGAPAASQAGTIWTVGPRGGGDGCPDPDFTAIQAAVDAAHPGDRIEVCPGVYREHVRFRHGDGGVVLRGEDATIEAPATLGGQAAPRGLLSLLGVRDVRITGLRFGACGALLESGFESVIHIERSQHIEIIGNRLEADGCDGISVIDTPGVRINRNTIWAYGIGVMLWGPRTGGTVYWNLLPCRPYRSPDTRCAAGVDVESGARGRILRNLIDAGPGGGPRAIAIGGGIEASGAGLLLRNNTVSNADQGVMVSGHDLIIRRNRITRNRVFGLWVEDARDGIIADNVVEENQGFGLAIGAWADTVSGFSIHDNEVTANGRVDCIDWTTGNGTLGTANRWFANHGGTSRPRGLCPTP